ncbi:C-C motif chemokine 5-like [Cololabis saira]|uniref:C-C motif chemokine 5-like n=1 Tax=Cololabis saira TaxID=129043 RepID=UPI002AD59386|nr:C-C motif chemokine 5-like [Cololabis saira]
MKHLSVAVGLLLLALYCTAMPQALNDASPVLCCFKFFSGRIPEAHIKSILQTHDTCLSKGFVINTPKGRLCVSQNTKWAKKAFDKAQVI